MLEVAVQMDPLERINFAGDSTFAQPPRHNVPDSHFVVHFVVHFETRVEIRFALPPGMFPCRYRSAHLRYRRLACIASAN